MALDKIDILIGNARFNFASLPVLSKPQIAQSFFFGQGGLSGVTIEAYLIEDTK